MRPRVALVCGIVALDAACGARSSLDLGAVDGAPSGGGGFAATSSSSGGAAVSGSSSASGGGPTSSSSSAGGAPAMPCGDAGATTIYLVSTDGLLESYAPPTPTSPGDVSTLGQLDCGPGITPYSMAVDRTGVAYVLFSDARVYRVDTADASCTPTPFVPDQAGFRYFGMGFSADVGAAAEQLYVAQASTAPSPPPSKGLARIDTQTFELSFVGTFSTPLHEDWIELTGTGDGRLFGYGFDVDGSGGHLVEIDKDTATVLSSTPLSVGDPRSAIAFAAYGGAFYIFGTSGAATAVTRFDPPSGAVTVVSTIPGIIVGAGVSTCAPL